MGKDKSLIALKHIINLNVEVVAVVCDKQNSKLRDTARFWQLPVCSDVDIYDHLNKIKMMKCNLN